MPGWIIATLLGAFALGTPSTVPTDDSWRQSPVWDDGQAEFAAYRVNWSRYGRLYPGRALLISVKEGWAPDLNVKADTPRENGFEVLKLNHIRDVRTGIYQYHQMGSVFLRRSDGGLQKLSASSQEACGMTSAQLVSGLLDTWSYFDGQAHRQQPWPQGALPRDGLPLSLRDYLKGPIPDSLSIAPSLLTGKFKKIVATQMKLSRRSLSLEVPAGKFQAIELTLTGTQGASRYSFNAEIPHTLLRYEGADGTTYELVKAERLAYWSMKKPQNASWWPESLRNLP